MLFSNLEEKHFLFVYHHENILYSSTYYVAQYLSHFTISQD